MDFSILLGILGIGYLALPIVAIVALVIGHRRLKEMNARLARLESGPGPGTVVAALRPDDHRSEPAPEPEEPPASAEADTEHPDDAPEDRDADDAAPDASATPKPEEARPPAQKPKRDLEALIGGRWSVLLGGITLAIGLVFLARYSIESGLLGPKARLLLGAALSAALVAGGEWMRRMDKGFAIPAVPSADVPGILTGVGISGGFAALYAAHAVYGFIGPGVAFVGLTLLGLAALLLSSLHGPKLAALGVLGAYATPALVSSQSPNSLALAGHVLVVTLAVLGIARIREWLWLGLAGVIAATLWTMAAAFASDAGSGIAGLAMVCGLALIFMMAFAWNLHETFRQPADQKPDLVPATLSASLIALAFLFQIAVNSDLPLIPTAIGLTLILMAAAAYWPALAAIALTSAIAALLAVAAAELPWAIVDGLTQTADIRYGLVPPDTSAYVRDALFIAAPAVLLATFGSLRLAAPAPGTAGWLASSVGTICFFGLVIVYLRIAPFETRPLIGAVALVLAVANCLGSEAAFRARPNDLAAPAPAAFLVASLACLSMAIGVSLDTGWMPIAFAATAFGIAVIYPRRKLAPLPWLALASAVIAFIPVWAQTPFEAGEIGRTPFFNGLILLLGIPALLLVAAGEWLRRHDEGSAGSAIVAVGLAFAGLFVSLEIQHALNDGNLQRSSYGLAEHAAQSIAALGFAIGLQLVARRTNAPVYQWASMTAGIISMAMIAIGLLLVHNPGLSGDKVGEGVIFNLLLLGYLLPALLAAIAAWLGREARPRWYTLTYAALSGLLLFAYASLMLRKSFTGDALSFSNGAGDAEFWSYSALWLILGALVLALGIKLRSTPIRIASGLLIALTVCKVFLLDMSELEGALRAFSFIGLGLSLLAIGRFYQRLMRGQQANQEAGT